MELETAAILAQGQPARASAVSAAPRPPPKVDADGWMWWSLKELAILHAERLACCVRRCVGGLTLTLTLTLTQTLTLDGLCEPFPFPASHTVTAEDA